MTPLHRQDCAQFDLIAIFLVIIGIFLRAPDSAQVAPRAGPPVCRQD